MDRTEEENKDEEMIASKIAEEIYSQQQQTSEPPAQPEETAVEEETVVSEPQDDKKTSEPTHTHEKLSFVQKLMAAMNDSKFSQFLFWNTAGDEIHIVDSKAFATRVLPSYFERSSFGPFVKELVRWGFTKKEPGHGIESAFSHKYFLRDRPEFIAMMSFKGRPKTKPSSVIKNMKKVQGAMIKPPLVKATHEKVYPEYLHQHQGDVKSSSQGDAKMQGESEGSGERRVQPGYPPHYFVGPSSLHHLSQGAGAIRSQQISDSHQDASKHFGRYSIPGSTSQPQVLTQNAAMNSALSDQAYALRLLTGEKGVSSGGQSGTNTLPQQLSQGGSSVAEQPLRSNLHPDQVKAILEMSARQNPLQSAIELETLNSKMMNQGVPGSAFGSANSAAQSLHREQQYSHYGQSSASSSNPPDFQSTTAPSSELSADINAAIEKEVARRLDSIMSVAANLEIMKEQAKATAHIRMAAASSLQQHQEPGVSSTPGGLSIETLEALEEYRQMKNRMGQNP